MSYIEKIVSARAEMNNLLVAEQNPQAQLLKHCDRAYLGGVLLGDKTYAIYDSQLMNALGVDQEKQRELSSVGFLIQGYLSLENASLAVMSYLETSGEAQVNDSKEDTPVTAAKMKLSREIADRYVALLKECMENDLDLAACVSQFLNEKRQA